MQKIQAVIFDVDGVLFDSMWMWDELDEKYLRSLGLEMREETTKAVSKMSFEEAADYLRVEYRLDLTVEEIVGQIQDMVRNFYYQEVTLKEGVRRMLENLARRGIPAVIASASDLDMLEHALTRCQIRPMIKKVFTCSEVGAGKTRPDVFLAAAEYLGVQPEHCLIVEDSLHAIETAIQAGFVTAGVYDESSRLEQDDIRNQVTYYVGEQETIDSLLDRL